MRLTLDEKLFLGERGSRMAGRRNFLSFYAFAEEANVPPKTLELLARAYDEGGASGILAIEPGGRLSAKILEKAVAEVESFLRRHFPGKSFSLRTWGNAISVELRAGFGEDGAMLRFQLRFTSGDGKWHLYWRRSNGRWWPYYSGTRVHSLKGCLREVLKDTFGCFLS